MARLAGSTAIGDTAFDATFHPHAMRLLERCDAVVTTARGLGLAIFTALEQVPGLG